MATMEPLPLAANAAAAPLENRARDDGETHGTSPTGCPLKDTIATALQPLVLPDGPVSPVDTPAPPPSPPTTSDTPGSHAPRHPRGPTKPFSDGGGGGGGLLTAMNAEKQLCMLCPKRFDMDEERDLFLAHLVMDHNVVIADVKHVPYFPGYVEEWRKMFETLSLDICPKIKTNYVAKPEGIGVGPSRKEEVVNEEDEDEEEAAAPLDEETTALNSSGESPERAEYEDAEETLALLCLAALSGKDGKDGADCGGGSGGVAKRRSGGGDEEVEEEEVVSPAPNHGAGDAPAFDVLKRSTSVVRPALEVEDPAIAEAHPAVPTTATFATRMEGSADERDGLKPRRASNAAVSSDSVETMCSSSSSSFLSMSNSATLVSAAQGEEYHYLLCDTIPQDHALRHRLQRKRLEYALQRQEAERNDVTFSRLCLFCNAYFEGNRAGLFHHMAEDHNFNVGQPDNIVFSNEFLDTLQSKLDNSICLYCEKDFKDKTTLKDHMRKKMHRRIRGSNREYDKFYLINYLELGKSWNDIQSEDDIEIRPGPAAESEWADWTGEGTFSVCLFCSYPSCGAEEIYAHMRVKHGFDLSRIRATLKLSFYQQIKLINFYRRKLHENVCPTCSLAFPDKESTVRHMQETNHTNDVPALVQWDQPQFFFPTYENDHLLSLLEDVDDNPEVAVVQPEDPPDSSIYNSILARNELRQEIIYDSGPVGYKGRTWK